MSCMTDSQENHQTNRIASLQHFPSRMVLAARCVPDVKHRIISAMWLLNGDKENGASYQLGSKSTAMWQYNATMLSVVMAAFRLSSDHSTPFRHIHIHIHTNSDSTATRTLLSLSSVVTYRVLCSFLPSPRVLSFIRC